MTSDAVSPNNTLSNAIPGETSLQAIKRLFAAEDDQFVQAVRQEPPFPALQNRQEIDSLAEFVDLWKTDSRPWARAQIRRYLGQPWNCPGHNVVIKRLFKHAEEQQDDQLMADFLVALDTHPRHPESDLPTQADRFYEPAGRPQRLLLGPPLRLTPQLYDTQQGGWWQKRFPPERILQLANPGPLFSAKTTRYLRRRAWRYFRHLGYRRPADYIPAVCQALIAYRDEHLQSGEELLVTWGLVQICFSESHVLVPVITDFRLRPGQTLQQLAPAPRFSHLWKQPQAVEQLSGLVSQANSHLVRAWAIGLLQQLPNSVLNELPLETVISWVSHSEATLAEFGRRLLEERADLAQLTPHIWLNLLKTCRPTVLAAVCELVGKHLSLEALTFDQCLHLACQPATPVARLGMKLLKKWPLQVDQRDRLVVLAEARCPVVAGELTSWALSQLTADRSDRLDGLCEFFDSLLLETRTAAWEWLTRAQSQGQVSCDPRLLSRLVETPFEDLRLKLVDALQNQLNEQVGHQRSHDSAESIPQGSRPEPSFPADPFPADPFPADPFPADPFPGAEELLPVWSSVLLGVVRGGRQKLRAIRQLGRALSGDLSQAECLLPVLAVAVRSIRGPEAAVGLSTVVELAHRHPQLAGPIRQALPELELPELELPEVSP